MSELASTSETSRTNPLVLPHILLQTLSYTSLQTLSRCMSVSSFWYDIATTFLWAHVNYRVNRFLTDPGVTPFLPVPEGMTGLRRAKRRAVRHVRVVEVRTHDCEEVGCASLSLHGGGSEGDEGTGEEPKPIADDGSTGAIPTESSDSQTAIPRESHALLAIRLHIDNNHKPRPIPFPCPFISQLNAATIVLLPVRQLSTAERLPLPSPPSLRKLVLLLIPPTQPPGEHRLAESVPDSVDEVVIYLWRRHPQSQYDNFSEGWGAQMTRRHWGPQKLWGHWCNFILALNRDGRKPRRFTFVAIGCLDPAWLSLAGRTWEAPDVLPKNAGEAAVQARFEAGLRACLKDKMSERRLPGEEAGEEWDAKLKACQDNVQFLSRKEYLGLGGWEGEFTRDEVMYHG